MFTGIIEETGIIKTIKNIRGGKRIVLSANRVLEDLRIEHSIAVSGVCLTVVDCSNSSFSVEAVGETLDKSTIGKLKQKQRVNLERAMSLNARLGGHLLQGHVNGVGRIDKIRQRGDNWFFEIKIPEDLKKYVIPEGSIAIDGISLTIATLEDTRVGLSIIPYTYQNTTLNQSKPGDDCNIETDIIGRYVENLLFHKKKEEKNNRITTEWLKSQGF
jgi:riboflavin synthase